MKKPTCQYLSVLLLNSHRSQKILTNDGTTLTKLKRIFNADYLDNTQRKCRILLFSHLIKNIRQPISHPIPGYSQRVKLPLCLNPEGTLEVTQTNVFHVLLRKQRFGAGTLPVWGSLHYILAQLCLSQTFMCFSDQL